MSIARDTFLTLNAIQIVLRDSDRTEQIHIVEETTGRPAFRRVLQRVRNTEEGRELLAKRPILSTKDVDYAALRAMPPTTLGGAYVRYLDSNGLNPDSQATLTQYVDEPDVAYMVRRFRQTHDVWHPITGLNSLPYQEVLIHAFSYGQLRLPVSAMVVFFGSIKHGLLEARWQMLKQTLWQAYQSGKNAHDLIGVYWEKYWDVSIEEIRRKYNVAPVIV